VRQRKQWLKAADLALGRKTRVATLSPRDALAFIQSAENETVARSTPSSASSA
jgi:hypothetical protein